MHREELETLQHSRSELWRMACHGEITVDELYAGLRHLRKLAGVALYDRPPQPKYQRR